MSAGPGGAERGAIGGGRAGASGPRCVCRRERVRAMFYHAYEHYLESAFPYDELRPLTCDGHDTWGR